MNENQTHHIKPITESDLPTCLEVIRRSFATVAEEFHLTEQNCPTNGAFMTMERLKNDFDNGNPMFGYVINGHIVGFAQLAKIDKDTFELGKLAVLPAYRHRTYGKQLFDYACAKVNEFGGKKMNINIIEKNTRLRKWYKQNGCIHKGVQSFSNLPFTVGFMERQINQ